ncbi:MAG: beta-ketoacyl-ACP synthase II [Nanoarchaeota archaeon]
MDRRVVITGLGVVSPIGIGKEVFWENLISGKSGVKKITKFDTTNFACKIAAEVPEFNPEEFGVSLREAKRLDSFSLYSQVATGLALNDSGINIESVSERAGAVIASGIGGLTTLEEQVRRLIKKSPDKVSALLVIKLMANAAAGNASIKYNLRGPAYSVASACASGTHAIIRGYNCIKQDDADVMLVGGSEAVITPVAVAGFSNMGALSLSHNNDPEKASRPFDKERDGLVMGEGAGVLALEELEQAKKRNVHIYAEIIGYGETSDAHHETEPTVEGPARAMMLALKKAKLDCEDVQYINAHGTSTPLNDKNETEAIKRVFGEHARKLAISSTKSMVGHLLGAAGGLETIVCALVIDRGIIPPTINYETPDPECDLDYVPNKAREMKVNAAMNNSFGFGGHNAVLVLKKY